jgi:hypothetical protein
LAPSVVAVTGRLVELLDARLPGQLEAFYLVGSIALGDYREGRSDIDFIAVLADEPDIDVLAALHAELARTHPVPRCDGIYLRPGELSTPAGGTGLELRDGQPLQQSAGERHPVTWLILADAGIALRGRTPDHGWVMADRAAAIQHSRDNLRTYWRHWLEVRRRLLSRAGLTLLTDEAVTWGALGIARLHATIATGRLPSKSGAGHYALGAFPDHSRIVGEALRLRAAPTAPLLYRSPFQRRRDLIVFMDAVLRDDRA